MAFQSFDGRQQGPAFAINKADLPAYMGNPRLERDPAYNNTALNSWITIAFSIARLYFGYNSNQNVGNFSLPFTSFDVPCKHP